MLSEDLMHKRRRHKKKKKCPAGHGRFKSGKRKGRCRP